MRRPLLPPFAGVIGDTTAESTPSWSGYQRPASGAPNVVMIVLDDVGFGQLGRFGGSIQTPAMDSIGEQGITYTNFHVASLCSPTRAMLLTGRNHHSVGMGFLAGFDTGYPNSRGHVDHAAGTLARMLGEEGYACFALGKWHLTPASDMSPAGPYHYWPLGQGFDRFYGYLWGEDNQWAPQLWEDNHSVETPTEPGYHFSAALADKARSMIADHVTAQQDRPFFLYFALGAGHAPHHAPQDLLDRYRGSFDDGWDAERERILARQLATGIVPDGTELAPRNDGVVPWDELNAEQRLLYTRLQEAFAAFMDHADQQVGRVLSMLEEQGLADDTLVMVLSDNGASGDGGPDGSVNEYRYFLELEDSLEYNLAHLDEIGGPLSHNHYPSGWAQAGNTPLRYYKKTTYAGGVRAPLMMRWPRGLGTEAGRIVTDFAHATDLTPTVLQAAGIVPKPSYDGIAQMPIHGRSLIGGSDAGGAAAGVPRRQYFEMIGNRGIWSDGWKALTRHRSGEPYDLSEWQLYDTTTDFSELHDVAAEHPELVAELDAAWWEDARRFGVLPLDDRMQGRSKDRGPLGARRHFRMLAGTRAFTSVGGPNWANRSFRVHARVTHHAGDDGVILAFGRRAAGFALFVLDEHLVLEYNRAGDRTVLRSDSRVPEGSGDLVWTMRRTAPGQARATLSIQDRVVADMAIPTMGGGLGTMATQVGFNAPSAVSNAYEAPFRFRGEIEWVDIDFLDETPEPNLRHEVGFD